MSLHFQPVVAQLPLEFVVVGGGKFRSIDSFQGIIYTSPDTIIFSFLVHSPRCARPVVLLLRLTHFCVYTGIGGLSVAYMLASSGHKVRVLEKHSGLGTPAASICVPPNMSKILKTWVGEEELRKIAVHNVASSLWDCKCCFCIGASTSRHGL
jgi:hypothetical protein